MRYADGVSKYSPFAFIVFTAAILGLMAIGFFSKGDIVSRFETNGRVIGFSSLSGRYGNSNQITVRIKEADFPITLNIDNEFYRKGDSVSLRCRRFESNAISCHSID